MRPTTTMIHATVLGIAALAFGAHDAAPPTAKADAAATKLAETVCSNCHGPGGDSVSPLFPNLAAQQQVYLAAQIRAFKTRTARGEPEAGEYMHGMAALVDDATIDAIAGYYARQKPPAGLEQSAEPKTTRPAIGVQSRAGRLALPAGRWPGLSRPARRRRLPCPRVVAVARWQSGRR